MQTPCREGNQGFSIVWANKERGKLVNISQEIPLNGENGASLFWELIVK